MTGDQRLLDFLGEQPLAADLGEQSILHPVPGRADRHDFHRPGGGEPGLGSDQPIMDESGLAQRHRAAARPDAQRARGNGLSSHRSR